MQRHTGLPPIQISLHGIFRIATIPSYLSLYGAGQRPAEESDCSSRHYSDHHAKMKAEGLQAGKTTADPFGANTSALFEIEYIFIYMYIYMFAFLSVSESLCI